mgnify:FL=1
MLLEKEIKSIMTAGGSNSLIGISGKIGSGKDTVGSILQYLSCKEYELLNEDYSFASFLEDENSPYEIKKFAGKLKEIAALLIGCDVSDFEDREFKEKELGKEWWKWEISFEGVLEGYIDYLGNEKHYEDEYMIESHLIKLTPRKLLQLLGTEAGRQVLHPNIWINALFADYVCDDCGQQECPTDEEDTGQMIHYSFPSWIITDVRFSNEAKAIKDRGGIMIRIERPEGESHCGGQHASETALDNYNFDYVIDNEGSIDELIEKIKQLKLV